MKPGYIALGMIVSPICLLLTLMSFLVPKAKSMEMGFTAQEASIDCLPNDLMVLMFQKYFAGDAVIHFYKTAKKYYNLLKSHLPDYAITQINGNPVLNLYKLYQIVKDPNESEERKSFAKSLMLTNEVVRRHCIDFFVLTNPHFPIVPGQEEKIKQLFPLYPRENCKVKSYLSAGFDPEIVAIMATVNRKEMCEGLGYFEDIAIAVIYIDVKRAEPLLDQVFRSGLHDLVDFVGQNPIPVDHRLIELSMKFYDPDRNSMGERFEIFLCHLKTPASARYLIPLLGDQSFFLTIKSITILLENEVPIDDIVRICRAPQTSKILPVPDNFVPLLLKACVNHQDWALNVLLEADAHILVLAFWSEKYDDMARSLGYSEEFCEATRKGMWYNPLI